MSTAKLVNVNKIYPNKVQAVFDFNLEVKDKEFIVFVGPSGCGKSTTLRMIAGLEEISSGELYIDDEFCNYTAPKDRNIAMVFQSYALYPHMTVYDNMAFGLKMKKTPKNEIKERIMEAAKILDIEQYLDRKPRELSGGQRQRVALGRAIVRNAKIFLMDEPLSNLDARLRLEMREEIRRIQTETHVTAIFVTHDQEEALSISDEIVLLNKGVVQQIAKPQELYEEPKNLFAATFLGVPPICLVHGKIENGKFVAGNDVISWSKLEGIKDGTPITLGIRAEALKAVDSDTDFDIEARITGKYVIGKDALAIVEINKEPVRFYLTEEMMEKEIGDSIELSFKKKGAYVFTEDGNRIR